MRLFVCSLALCLAPLVYADADVVKPIGIAPAQFHSVESSSKSQKPVPRELAKGIKYVVHWHDPLSVGVISLDGGTVKITDRRGPRAYAKEKTITDLQPDADNDDIITCQDTFIYEITAETSGNVIVLATPALKNDKDGKQAPITFADTVQRFLKLTGSVPVPDPIPDDDATVAAVRKAYNAERDPVALGQLIDVYKSLDKKLADFKTWGDFFRAMTSAREAAIAGRLPQTRSALGSKVLDPMWPDKMDEPIIRATAHEGLATAIKTLEGLK